MLAGLVEKFLISYFGEFIENLEKDKISLGVININELNKITLDMERILRTKRHSNKKINNKQSQITI